MHSLKPTGDNIAQEFLRILGNQGLVKSAFDLGVEAEPGEGEGEGEGESEGGAPEASDFDFLAELEEQLDQSVDVGDHAKGLLASVDFEEMITDEGQFDVSEAGAQLDAMDAALDSFAHTDSEKRVLVGLSKIAGSLRAKGEAFAADVVDATAISIQGDLKKEAGRKAKVVSGLKKLASEFYNSGDSLAGDMVQVTINKIAVAPFSRGMGDDAFRQLEEVKEESDKPEDKSNWPKDKAGIPAAITAMNAEIKALPPGEGIRGRAARAEQEMKVHEKYGFVSLKNGVYTFKIQSGGTDTTE